MTRLLLLLLALSPLALALDPDEDDPRAIVTAVEARAVGQGQRSTLRITVKDAAGRERVRELSSTSLRVPGATRQLLRFTAPADLRGAGLLTVDHDDPSVEDDQWLYLPSAGRATRIATTDRSASFMGTDLSYADLTRKDPDAYDYAMLQQDAEVDGERAWVIEARARTEAERAATGVLKSELSVSKARGLVLRSKSWVIEGRRMKYVRASDFREAGGQQLPGTLTVRTTREGALESESVLQVLDLVVDPPGLTEAMVSLQALEQGL